MWVFLLVVCAAAWAEVRDVVMKSMPFVRNRPLGDHVAFVYLPLALTFGLALSCLAGCWWMSGRRVTITMDTIRIFCKGPQGSYTEYVEVPFSEIRYTRGGFYPFHYADIGSAAMRQRLHAIFLPGYYELLDCIESRSARSRRLGDAASEFLREQGKT